MYLKIVEKQGSKLYIGQIAGKMGGQNYTLDNCRKNMGVDPILPRRGILIKNAIFVKLGGQNTTYFKFQVKMRNSYKNRGRISTFAIS